MSLRVKEEKGDRTSGFYCDVCDCTLKDSLNYLDHVRGKRHNRNIGISLRDFTDSTLDEVKQMLEFKKRERDGQLQGDERLEGNDDDDDEDEEEKYSNMKREKKKRQKARRSGRYEYHDEDEDDDDDDGDDDDRDNNLNRDKKEPDDESDAMAKLMGFSSFSGTR